MGEWVEEGCLGTKATCLESEYIWGRGQRGSGLIGMDQSPLRDKGVGTRAKKFRRERMQRGRAIGLLEKGPVDLMATTDLVGGGASALVGGRGVERW